MRRLTFVISLKTAKALGLTIPRSLLLRADEVIRWTLGAGIIILTEIAGTCYPEMMHEVLEVMTDLAKEGVR